MSGVSVIVRCLNEEAHIGRLLTGISRQTVLADEVIVVDSGSTDATLDIAQRYPRVRVVSIAPAEFTFGRSLNLGCGEASGDVLVIVSAHVYPVYPTWLEELTAPFSDASIALTYGRQEGDDLTKFSEHQVLRKWFPAEGEALQRHPFCNNANAAVRRAVWELLPYNEELTGLEDLDWAKRAVEKDYSISYAAGASVVHVHEESWSQVRNRYRREAIAYSRIYPDERMSALEAAGLALLNVGSDLVRAARMRCFRKELVGILLFRGSQFLGSYLGFRQAGPVSAALRRRFYYPRDLHRLPPDDPGRARIDYADPPHGEPAP